MPYLQLDGRPIPLVAGSNDIGSADGARVRIPAAGVPSRSAVVELSADGAAVIRRVGEAVVRLNGVVLGVEPAPLLHGDKVGIGESELTFGDDRKAGNTSFVRSVRIPEASAATGGAAPASAVPAGGGSAQAAVSGRLVSLVDGREYLVPSHGLLIGRDPTCDVVVAAGDVSRKHATVAPSTEGYVLTDTSANGVLVNGEPVASRRRLARGDTVMVGEEEFRFYADAAPAVPAPALVAPSREPVVPAVPAPPAPVRQPLATLEVVSTGVLHGRAFPILTPLAHVGRGAHNDVVLPDESVSDTHAKLQRREGGWFVVDMGSTNGTYVGGRRIDGEAALVGAPDLRVGGVKFIFRPGGSDAEGAGHTRAIAAMTAVPRAPAAPAPAAAPERARPAPARPDDGGRGSARGTSPLLWFVIAVAVAAAVVFLLKGR